MSSAGKKRSGEKFAYSKSEEVKYARQIKKAHVAISQIIESHMVDGEIKNMPLLKEQLKKYSTILDNWARVISGSMLASVKKRVEKAFKSNSKEISEGIKKIFESKGLGGTIKELQAEQVKYITSLPLDAAERVQKIVVQGVIEGKRPSTLAHEIMKQGQVTKSRAELIARTEVAKANSTLAKVRAKDLGLTHYTWKTVDDPEVRPSHKALHNKVFSYDDPPFVSEEEGRHGPGDTYNCRCYAVPAIPD